MRMDTSAVLITHNSALNFWRWYRTAPISVDIRRKCTLAPGSFVTRVDALNAALKDAAYTTCTSTTDLFGPILHVAANKKSQRLHLESIVSHILQKSSTGIECYMIADNIYVLPPETCFTQVSANATIYQTLLLGMEWCGTYSLDRSSKKSYAYNLTPLCTVTSLKEYLKSTSFSHGSKADKTSAYLSFIVDNSASYAETTLVLLLTLPYKYGGYGFKQPLLNPSLDNQGMLIPPGTLGSLKPDLYWPEYRVAIEYNSREFHENLNSYGQDTERRERLEHMGIKVIPVLAKKLYDVERFDELAKELSTLFHKRLQLPDSFTHTRNELRTRILK